MNTPDQALAPIKARLEAATPGPFIVARYDHGGGRMFVEAVSGRRELIADTFKIGDREFYAEAATDITRLLDAIGAVEAIHQPITHHWLTPPAGSVQVCRSCREEYPCPTVAALSEALGADDRLAQFQADPEGRALVAGIHERKKAQG